MSNETFDLNGSADPQAADDALPAELTPVHERLVADGAAWRTHVPAAQMVIAGARARLLASAGTTDSAQPVTSSRQPAAASLDRARPQVTTQMRPPASFSRGFIATSAAVLLVGLIGAVLYTIASHRPGATTLAHTQTATAVGRPTPVPNRWLPVSALSGQPNVPMLAPSDPSVVYEVRQDSNASTSTLVRSDNGGASWQSLPVPQYNGAPVMDPQVRVSPVDAKMVFLQGGVFIQHFNPSSCDQISPVADASMQANALLSYPLSDSSECYLDYMSTDGGEHWSGLEFPVNSQMLQGGYAAPLTDLHNIQVQGARIFLILSYTYSATGSLGPVVRLVSSADGGKTWQTADSQLIQQGAAVCVYRADPTGVALYADVSAHNCIAGAATQDSLWRSDDGGAHWRKVGSLPGKDELLLDVAHGADSQHPVLVSTAASADGMSTELVISQDDGATWQQAPARGIPSGGPYGPLQTDSLSDGTLVAMYLDASKSTFTGTGPSAVVFLAWKPGATSWRQVTPEQTFPGQLLYAMVQGGDTLETSSVTVVTQLGGFPPGPGSTAEVTRCRLSPSSAGG